MFRQRNIIVQGVPESTRPDHTNSDIWEWKFTRQYLKLKNILIQQMIRPDKRDEDSGPRLMKIIILSSRVAAASLEAFITNKRRLPSVIHMQL